VRVKKIILGALSGGIVAYLWGVLSWMILPWHMEKFSEVKNQDKFISLVKENFTESGIYLIPNFPKNPDPDVQNEYMRKKSEGPSGILFLNPHGSVNFQSAMIVDIVLKLIYAALLSILSIFLALKCFYQRAFALTLFATMGGILIHLNNWNWWGYPLGFTLIEIFDLIVAWLLASLAIAKLTAPIKVEDS